MPSVSTTAPGDRIAVFLPSLEGGGAERVVLNLIHGLCARGLTVDLVLAQHEGELANQIPTGVHLVRLSPLHLPLGRTFTALPLLCGYLRRVRPTVLLTVSDRAAIVGLTARSLSRSTTRVVVSVHRLFSCEMHGIRRLYLKVIRHLARMTYTAADAVVAVSEGAAREVAASTGLPPGHIDVIYNPVLMESLRTDARRLPDHAWFSPGDGVPTVVSVGRLEPPKDFATLFHAFAALRRRRRVRLLILGEGPQRADLVRLIRDLDLTEDVDLPGFVQNPYQYMARAAAVVLSSSSEALPTVLIEALYLGRPVISTDCPTGPREILAGGKYGRLVPVGDSSALAEALEEAVAGNATPQSPDSWRRYTLDAATNKYLAVLLHKDRRSKRLAQPALVSTPITGGE